MSRLTAHLPLPLRLRLRRARNALALVEDAPRWLEIARTTPARDAVAVSYGYDLVPALGEVTYGGAVKFSLLAHHLSNRPRDFNVLYLGSSSMPRDAGALVRLARRRGARFVWNQNGVAYPAWHGPGWEEINRPRAHCLRRADYVLYQSAFSKLSADRWYGEREGPWEILHNPVDTERFTPSAHSNRPLTLLLGGNQYQRYRLEVALRTTAVVRRERPDVRLLVSGTIDAMPKLELTALIDELDLADAVELVGVYTQAGAPALLRRADVLVHPKVNDPCPTIVLEAMACGVPVAYSATGGTPELVGEDGGVGVPGLLDWERDIPPAPEQLAAAVFEVADRLPELRVSARARAVDRFDARRWIARHQTLFEQLLAE